MFPYVTDASESEERGHGEGGGVYDTLMVSDTLHPDGLTEEGAWSDTQINQEDYQLKSCREDYQLKSDQNCTTVLSVFGKTHCD